MKRPTGTSSATSTGTASVTLGRTQSNVAGLTGYACEASLYAEWLSEIAGAPTSTTSESVVDARGGRERWSISALTDTMNAAPDLDVQCCLDGHGKHGPNQTPCNVPKETVERRLHWHGEPDQDDEPSKGTERRLGWP
jgi:hypothetical protein